MNVNTLKGRKLSPEPPNLGAWGYPPSTYVSDSMIVNSMPILEITPGYPKLQAATSVFTIEKEPAIKDFNKFLDNLGFSPPTLPLKFAFIADNFPTDSFSNEYGESFLQGISNFISEPMSQIAQMTGARGVSEVLKGAGNLATSIIEPGIEALKTISPGAAEFAGGAFSTAKEYGGKLSNFLENAEKQGGVVGLLSRLAVGERMDFPQIWKSSSHVPQYSMTIRLYNPLPGNGVATRQYIVAPLALLMTLCVPMSFTDSNTYTWPFFIHEARVPGLWDLTPAVITNLTIVKGGDQQQIALNQRPGIIDVRLDITTLFSVMINSLENLQNRPTVGSYLTNMLTGKEVTLDSVYDQPGRMAGIFNIDTAEAMANEETLRIGEITLQSEPKILDKTAATSSEQLTSARVPTDLKELTDSLSADLQATGVI